MVVQKDVGNKVTHFLALKLLGLCLAPAKQLGKFVVIEVVEGALCIPPKQVVYLVRTAGGQVQVGLGEWYVHTMAHQKFLYSHINQRNLTEILPEKSRLCLLGIYPVVEEDFLNLSNPRGKREAGHNEIDVLKHL